jgi:NAD(P)-dependent dehydrogenase (short-subunit alcohol dehydrogenase family)
MQRLSGQVIVVTGASSGIGEAAAKTLHRLRAEVHVIGRSLPRTTAVAEHVGTEPIIADFTRLSEVTKAAQAVLAQCPRIDVLVNNAGVSVSRREETPDGHELMFQVNHLAPFLLTDLLLDRLTRSSPSRVITTSSVAHLGGLLRLHDLDTRLVFLGVTEYSTTKLENILFTRELDRRHRANGILTTCFNPGVVATEFGRDDPSGFLQHSPLRGLLRTPEQGADTLIWLATQPAETLRPGGYYSSRRLGIMNPQAYSGGLASRLWEHTERILGLAR